MEPKTVKTNTKSKSKKKNENFKLQAIILAVMTAILIIAVTIMLISSIQRFGETFGNLRSEGVRIEEFNQA